MTLALDRPARPFNQFTEYDFHILGEDISQWLWEISDPHEFATSFVNWIEDHPDAKGDLFKLIVAIEHWEAFQTLEGLT